MLTTQDKQLISNLIKKYAGNISTDSMIAFVADTSGLLSVCKTLVTSNNQDDQHTIDWVDKQCFEHQVDVHGFLFEVEQIVSIFQPRITRAADHEILGLDEAATEDEIKQAYRRLSRKYHPDTASSDDVENSDMFVKINKAYQVLLGENENSQNTAPPVANARWRNAQKSRISGEQKKKNLLWFSVLAIGMIVASLIVAGNYRNRVMLAGLQSNGAAFIPPEPAIQTENDAQEQEVEVEVEEIVEKPVAPPEEKTITNIPDEKEQKVITAPPIPVKKAAEITEIDAVTPSQKPDVIEKPPVTKLINNTKPVKKKKQPEVKVKAPPVPPTESVAPETSPSPSEKLQDNTQQKIEQFLAAYTKSYEDKDLLSFTRFYDPKATENGNPLAEIITTYSDLFQNSETITLSVTVLKWNREQEGIYLDGRFQIDIQYKDSTEVSGSGQISFLLAEKNDQFEIQELTYQFDTK